MTTKVKLECMDCGCYFYVKDRNNFDCPNCQYLVKFECMDCGCYFYVKDRNNFDCPNCQYLENEDLD